jgi:multicomponent Na+:H+ antiporter subunit C
VSLAPYLVAGWLLLVGLYGAATSRHLVHMIVCLTVAQSSTVVLLLAIGYRTGASAPYFATGEYEPGGVVVDPVVQTLTLTDIVVEATVAALLLALAVQAHNRFRSVDPDELGALRG